MLWNVAAPFFTGVMADQRWLDDFVGSPAYRFRKIPFARSAASWHQRASRGTTLGGWRTYWDTAGEALRDADGVITIFPQLAVMAGVRRLFGRKVPIVAWCFNLGEFPGGPRRLASRIALAGVSRFIVHSTAEIPLLARYLGIDESRVRFVPLQRAPIPVSEAEDNDAPFIVAMGSANRDYATLIEAARATGLPVTIVASPRSVAGLDIPANVTLLSGLDIAECRALAQRARFSIVPIADVAAASGQVTVLEAMRMRRAVIATRSIGTVDYVEDGETGRLVAGGDAAVLGQAMRDLWEDAALRDRLATAGARFAEERLSDEAAGRALREILDEIAAARLFPASN